MPEFRISKEGSLKDLELVIALDFDLKGNILNQEFLNGSYWSSDPSDLLIYNIFCDDEEQDEWNNFCYDFLNLLENGKLYSKLSNLKNINDSYYFSKEDIKAIVIEED